MITFQYWNTLSEGTTKPVLTHLTHIEDLILTKFESGAAEAVKFIESIANQFAGDSKAATNVSVKIDGSPSLVAGLDPSDGKFFIGTKGVFSKVPKLAKSHGDIDALYEPALAEKMHVAFDELRKLKWTGIMQGDVLFTKASKKLLTIDGRAYIGFKPNLIVYAVPVDSQLGARVQAANFGICFHTSYVGNSLDQIKVVPGANFESLKPSPSVLLLSNKYRDLSGTVTLTNSESETIATLLIDLKAINKTLPANAFLKLLKQSQTLRDYLMQYQNSLVRAGKSITLSPSIFATGFIAFLTDIKNREAASRKTEKGVTSVNTKFAEFVNAVASTNADLVKLTLWQNKVIEAKNFLMQKLNVANALETYYETGSGIVAGSGEGFVASDSKSNMVKLVDRTQFSRLNLTK